MPQLNFLDRHIVVLVCICNSVLLLARISFYEMGGANTTEKEIIMDIGSKVLNA